MTFPIQSVRAQFPSLNRKLSSPAGVTPIYFDNPGGTQVPERVIDAVSDYYRTANSNIGGSFETGRRTDEIIHHARTAMANLLNAPGTENILFGPNMTTLTFHIARSIADLIQPGDEIVLTDLDHDANVTPWTDLQADGAVIKFARMLPDCRIDLDHYASLLNSKTKLVAITHASNAVGVIPPVHEMTRMAKGVGAMTFIDAVQFAPHGVIDVQALDCDFLACSAYKFFGPHAGIVYGKTELLKSLKPHKVRPAKDIIPNRWETGTQNHECIAGIGAAVEYLASISGSIAGCSREALVASMSTIRTYEQSLSSALLQGLGSIPSVTIFGPANPDDVADRLPTVAFNVAGKSAGEVAASLGAQGIFSWSGNYYALRLMESLGLEGSGGALRAGAVHYNTLDEVERLIDAVKALA
ncbi:MAG: cysteine desulfurase-like protein [Chthonomonadales bacterium]